MKAEWKGTILVQGTVCVCGVEVAGAHSGTAWEIGWRVAHPSFPRLRGNDSDRLKAKALDAWTRLWDSMHQEATV